MVSCSNATQAATGAMFQAQRPRPADKSNPAGQPSIRSQPGTEIGSGADHVFIKASWSSARWVPARYIVPLQSKFAAFPGLSTCKMRLDYGLIDRYDRDAVEFFRPEDLRDLFVTVLHVPRGGTPFATFTGIIPLQQFEIDGSVQQGGVWREQGKAEYTAYGLELLLDRRSMHESVIAQGTDPSLGPVLYSAERVARNIDFNGFDERGARILQGNRSIERIRDDEGEETTYGFAADGDDATEWSLWDVAEYLTFHTNDLEGVGALTHEPKFVIESPVSPLDPRFDLLPFLRSVKEVWKYGGESVLSVLKRLADRRRGLGAVLLLNRDTFGLPTVDPVRVAFYSQMTEPVSFADATLPANPNQVTVSADTSIADQRVMVSEESVTSYDRIVVRGRRSVVAFSCATNEGTGVWTDDIFSPDWPYEGLGMPFENLEPLRKGRFVKIEPGWTAGEEGAYEIASDEDRQREGLRGVFRRFRIPQPFAWKMVDEEGLNFRLNPKFDETTGRPYTEVGGAKQVNAAAHYWNRDAKILNWLPYRDRSYASDETDSSRDVLARPFALVQAMPEADAELGIPPQWWVRVDLPPEGVPRGRFKPTDRALEFEVDFNPAHRLAKNHVFSGFESEVEPAFDYDRMIVTIALETDNAPAIVAKTNLGPTTDRQLTITVRDAEFWMVAPGTIAGVSTTGRPLIPSGGGIENPIRDDTPKLRRVATLAGAWYGRARKTMTFRTVGILDAYQPGAVVRAIKRSQRFSDVLTPITERSYDYVNQTTSFQTGGLELDVTRA